MADPNTPTPDDDTTQQREQLLESQRRAQSGRPRQVQDEAIDDKQVRIEPDGTGPSSTGSLDTPADQADGSGSPPR